MKDLARVEPVSVDEAYRRIIEAAPGPSPETVRLEDSYERIAAGPVLAFHDQPRFSSAAMDGWAVRGAAAGLYRKVGESRAGRSFSRRLEDGEAIRISTGAAVWAGATRVIRWEDSVDRGALIELPNVTGKLDIRERGSDFRAGDQLLPSGKRIDHLDVARLAAAGVEAVKVGRRPKIAILATGDELGRSDEILRPDQIYDSLSVPLALRARSVGAIVSRVAAESDDLGRIIGSISNLNADIVIVIGGASRGSHDHSKAAFAPFGLSMRVPSVRMRPGKPFWFGILDDGRFVLGLPGNPVAALACAELFLWPLLQRWQGAVLTTDEFDLSGAVLGAVDDRMDRFQFGIASIEGAGHLVGRPTGNSDSAALLPLLRANLLLRQPAGSDRLRAIFIKH